MIQVTMLDTVELATYSVRTFTLYKVRMLFSNRSVSSYQNVVVAITSGLGAFTKLEQARKHRQDVQLWTMSFIACTAVETRDVMNQMTTQMEANGNNVCLLDLTSRTVIAQHSQQKP